LEYLSFNHMVVNMVVVEEECQNLLKAEMVELLELVVAVVVPIVTNNRMVLLD
tara:strand:+ start:305 stop:463 length:159 start_codon:yes stop_codon:yes gene_type:complete